MYKKTLEIFNNKKKAKELGEINFFNSKQYTWIKTRDNIIDL